MTECFAALVAQECGDHGLTLASPSDVGMRGSQICFRHEQGYAIIQALIARGVVGDFRTPDILRFGFAPLYLRYQDMWNAVTHLRHVMDKHEWESPKFQTNAAVT